MKNFKFKSATSKLTILLVGLFLVTSFFTKVFASEPHVIIIRTFDASSQEVVVGQQEVPLMGFLVSANVKGHNIKHFIIRFYADDDGNFDNNVGDQKASHFIASASLYDEGGKLLSGPKALRSFHAYDDVFFDSLEYFIPSGTQKKFLVKINVRSAIPTDQAYLAAGFILSDVTAEEEFTFDAAEVLGNEINQGNTKDPVITVISGGNLSIRTVPVGIEPIIEATSTILDTFLPTVEYRFSPTIEPFILNKITVINDDSGEFDTPKSTCVVEKVQIRYRDSNNIIKIPESPLVNGSATFSNLNYVVPVGTETGSIMIQANINSREECDAADTTFRLGLRSVNNTAATFQAVGQISGTPIYDPDISASASVIKLTVEYPEPEPVVVPATLTLSKSTAVSSKSYNSDAQNAGILSFSLQTDDQAHKIYRIIARFYGDDDGSFNNGIGDQKANRYIASASLYDDSGQRISGPKPLRSYDSYNDVLFDSLNYTIPANTKKTFTVKVNLNNTATEKAYLAVGIKADGENVTVEDENIYASEIAGSDINLGTSKSPIFIVLPVVAETTPEPAPEQVVIIQEPVEQVSGSTYTVQNTGTKLSLHRISFVDSQTGWAVGASGSENVLIKTTNGGTSWSKLDPESVFSLFGIHFVNRNTGFLVGDSTNILKTTNGGSTWQSINGNGLENNAIMDINCNSAGTTCLAVGRKEQILRSTNSGGTWTKVRGSEDKFYSLANVAFASSNRVFAVGGGGLMLKSEDGGRTWSQSTQFSADAGFASIDCLSVNVCFAGGGGGVYKTTDGGGTWKKLAILNLRSDPLYPVTVRGIHFIDSSTGWAIGALHSGSIWESKDGGNTWKMADESHIKDLLMFNDLDFVGNEGWIAGNDGVVVKIKGAKTAVAPVTVAPTRIIETVPLKEREESIEAIKAALELLVKERSQLIREVQEIQSLIDEIKSYNFTETTEEAIKDSLARFETIIQSEDIPEAELERQKSLLQRRFEVSREAAREEKYVTGLIPFKDTDDDQWFTVFVVFAKARNIVSGYKDAAGNLTGEFRPGNNVTRAEILKMALEIADYDPAASTRLTFDHWSKLYVQKAKDLNLLFYREVISSPNKPATRGEVMKLILDVFGEQVPDPVLYELSDLHAPEGRFIQYAANLGIVDGYSDGTFRQDNFINRAEVSKILKNAFEILK